MLALVCSIVRRSAPVSVILDRIKTDVSLWIEAGVRQLGNRLFFSSNPHAVPHVSVLCNK
jgi:hypothetical protein